MPEFELPAYEGFEVEQEEAEVDESEVDAVLERMRNNMAEIITVGEDREPRDGDIAVIDFQALDEQGEPVPGVSADNFQLTLGEGQTLPDFETLIKGMKSGEEKEGPVSFPADFLNPEFAGRTVSMKVKLHAIKERKLPEDDEALAKKAGMATMEGLRNTLRKSYLSSRENLNKSATEKKLLDDLLKMVDFPVPDGLLENHIRLLVDNLRGRLERHGKDFSSLGKTMEQVREEMRPEAEMQARAHIFLLSLARKKGFEVSEQEVDTQLRRMAMQSGQDYNALKEYYTEHNLLFGLRDRLLADKAMEEIYDKALVKKVPPKKPEPAAEADSAAKPESDGEAAPETNEAASGSGE
jgi:trigger factor